MDQNINAKKPAFDRLVGLDAHPDTFTAALLRGQTPAQAVTEKVFNKLPLGQLAQWAGKHTTEADLIVLEASGNSFQIVRTLAALQRRALVLESGHLGRLKEAHASNDRLSAIRIGKAYLAGTAREVWVPDLKTQARRDLFHAQRKCVKRTGQVRSRLLSYLSDNGVRLPSSADVLDPQTVRQSAAWSPHQAQVIEGLLLELRHAQEQRQHWESLMAQEVLTDPLLLSLVRLCGVRDVIAFALGAILGDITRFANPKKLVKYAGLNPAFDDSGEGEWHGGLSGHGRKDLRSLLVEAAQAILRTEDPLGQWGRKLMARKSAPNLAVAAVARKLLVAIWYLMNGRWEPLTEITPPLAQKLGKIITRVGAGRLQQLGHTRRTLRQAARQSLKTGRTYVLKPDKQMPPPRRGEKPAEELVEKHR